MEKYDENDGVWRTVGGRRIFIKKGQSLSEAMKESGKFKNANKKKDIANMDPEEFRKEAELEKKVAIEKEKWRKSEEIRKGLSDKKSVEDKFGKDLDEYVNEKGEKTYSPKSTEKDLDRKNKTEIVRTQTNDIEKASGLKVEKAFETDAFGTGKEDRFKLSDGRYIAHSTESMGQKEDSWSINKVEGGKINSQEFKSYDDMIKHLSESGSGSSNSNSNEIMFKDKGTYGKYARGEVIGETKIDGEKGYIIKDVDGNEHKIPDSKTLKMREQNEVTASKGTKVQFITGNNEKGTIVRELSDKEIKKENDYLYTYSPQTRMYEVKLDNGKTEIVGDHVIKREGSKFTLSEEGEQKRKTASNAYKKAYQEYKKAHPNSKISLDKFIDISEGK